MADNIYVSEENVIFIRDSETNIKNHMDENGAINGGIYVSTDSGKLWVGNKRISANFEDGTGTNSIQQQGTNADAENSFTVGEGTIASSKNQTVVGQYNDTDVNALFVIGAGDNDEARKNALIVDQDNTKINNQLNVSGDTYIGGNLSLKSDNGVVKSSTVDASTIKSDTVNGDTVNAKIAIIEDINAKKLTVENPDGNIILETPDDDGYTIGKFKADEVYFTENFDITEKFGKYGPQDGSHTKTACPAKGKSVLTLLKEAFNTDVAPTITNPSISLTITNPLSKKVWRGSTVDVSYSIKFNKGTYSDGTISKIGHDEGDEVEPTYSVTFNYNTLENQSGIFSGGVINNSSIVSATASWEDDKVTLKDNQGELIDLKIKAGSDIDSATISTYLGCFYTFSDDKITSFDRSDIRDDWTHTTEDTFYDTLDTNGTWTNLYIAIPVESNITNFNPQEADGMQLPFVGSVHSSKIDVGDASDQSSVKYSIFKIENTIKYENTTINFNWKEV